MRQIEAFVDYVLRGTHNGVLSTPDRLACTAERDLDCMISMRGGVGG